MVATDCDGNVRSGSTDRDRSAAAADTRRDRGAGNFAVLANACLGCWRPELTELVAPPTERLARDRGGTGVLEAAGYRCVSAGRGIIQRRYDSIRYDDLLRARNQP